MGRRSKRGFQDGFTLIEVMITMFFLTIITGSLAMISIYAQRSGIHARRLTSANMIAERAMEVYRNTAYNNLPTLHNSEACFDAHMASVACGSNDEVFKRTTLVTEDIPVTDTTKMEVSVTWEEKMTWDELSDPGGTQTASVVSYISKF